MKKFPTMNEKDWQAEDDARVMAQYQEIMEDKGRMNRAVKIAQKQAKDLTKRANTMQKVAKFKYGGKKK